MTTNQMSITQALAEIKLLDKRLSKHIDNITWADVSTLSKPIDADKFKAKAQAEFQSYMDLMKRRDSIKRAIVLSHASTRVKIASWEGSVAEAIEHKKSIQYKQNLLEVMKFQLLKAKNEFESQKSAVDMRLERLLQSELGKDVKTNPETITALSTSFRSNNSVVFVDPLDLASKISTLENEVDSFETNADWVLSEANGRTMINV